jgi:hypothetical protein
MVIDINFVIVFVFVVVLMIVVVVDRYNLLDIQVDYFWIDQ